MRNRRSASWTPRLLTELMRSLGSRFVLAIGAFVATFLILVLVRTWTSADRHATELVAQQARLALEFDLAIRRYVADHIRPVMKEHLGPDEFEPETMSTSFVARSIFEDVRREFPDYVIKFSSDHPRNPANRAGPEELEIIRHFNENPSETTWIGEIELDGEPYYAYFSARRMEGDCLRCHGEPEDAPATLLERYGREAGFHRPVGDVIALDTIAVPLDRTDSGLLVSVAQDSLIFAAGLVLLFTGTIWTFRRLVTRRLTAIVRHFEETGERVEDLPDLATGGRSRDEIDALGASFNQLAGKLRSLRGDLEQRVRSRTTELTRANERLRSQVEVRQRTEVQLSEAKAAAESANDAKSQFLANVSHEIRTPMNGIVGMTQLALETDLDTEQREYLTLVQQSADSLLAVIDDVLDFSKIEAGRLELHQAEFGLRDRLRDTLAALDPRAATRGDELVCRIAPDVPDRVSGDANRLRQIVVNLIGNAIKFTDEGEIVLGVSLAQREADRVQLRFEVRDTGIGIPESMQRRIFEAFRQADGSATRRYGGTGLGLAISKRLVAVLGGEIGVESEVGRGSTFWFTAWFETVETSTAEVRDLSDVEGKSALVVDDGPTTVEVLSEILDEWGLRPSKAADAATAVRAIRRAEAPAVVVLDADLPGAVSVLEAYRGEGSAPSPVVLLTRAGGARVAEHELGPGFIVTKPVRPRELLRAIRRVLSGRRARPPATPTSAAPERPTVTRRARILVAEDNPVSRKLAVRMLEKQGHSVVFAEHGRAAVEAWERTRFDLIFMDVQMPDLDGLEATREIRSRESSTGLHTPIIAMTAHVMKGDRERCLDAGMDGFVSKPIAPETLLHAVQEALGDEPEVPPEVAPSAACVDLARLLRGLDGDVDLLDELIRVFRDDAERLLDAVESAVRNDDREALARAAHTIKGAVSNFAAGDAAAAARELERAAREGTDGAVRAGVSGVRKELDRLISCLGWLAEDGVPEDLRLVAE